MSVSRRLRFEVLRRDGYACRYCGAKAPDATLTVDHVIPTALGGGDEPNNLVTACADCNNGKSSTPPDAVIVEDVDAAALLWSRAIERAAEMREADVQALDAAVNEVDDEWWTWTNVMGRPYWRPDDWRDSVERFLAHGLTVDTIRRYVVVTMENRPERRWAYFCGCCWREVSRREELARRLIEDGEV